MTISRQWKNIIDNNHFFHTIVLHSHIDFNGFMSMNRAYQERGDNVVRLIIDIDRMSNIEAEALPLLIRNLCELYFYSEYRDANLPLTAGLQSHPWSETIRKIHEYQGYVLTRSILASRICPDLTEISTSGSEGFPIRDDFIQLLVNAPALLCLKLKNFQLSPGSLENIYTNIPNLNTLLLSDGEIIANQQQVNLPANNMRELSFKAVTISAAEDLRNLQEYLVAKYPNLTKLEHDILVTGEEFTDNIFNELVQEIGIQLTSIKIGPSAYYSHAITELVRIGHTNIEQFTTSAPTEALLNEQLIQLRNITQVEPLRVMYLNSIVNDSFTSRLVGYDGIQELNLSAVAGTVINMNNLLRDMRQDLERLHLSNFVMDFQQWARGTMQEWRGVTHLTLQSTSATNLFYLGRFMYASFPVLTHLKLDRCQDNVHTLHLHPLNLRLLEIRTALTVINQVDRTHQWVRVETYTTTTPIVTYYTAKPLDSYRVMVPFDRYAFPEVTSAGIIANNNHVRIDIHCNTVTTVLLANTLGV